MPTAKNLVEFETIAKSKPIKYVSVTGRFAFEVVGSDENESLIECRDYAEYRYPVSVVFDGDYPDWRDASIDSPFDLSVKYIVENFWPYLIKVSTAYHYFLNTFPELCAPYLTDKEIAERDTFRYDETKAIQLAVAQQCSRIQLISSSKLNPNHLFAHEGEIADTPLEQTSACSSSHL
ncbi:TPA: hypothetical protein KKX58_003110 [Legionella pneumophila]|nr:hypothetical protein [Legionella pneumophila]HBD7411753.1 hypothetical protein [Legionella pneumophila]HBD9406942.1 hypothetical protein [Legionella pneumophila]HBI2969980.1 hypothetical protein [Legionella pneumophila]